MRRALPTFSLRTVLSKRCWHSCPPVTSLPKPASPAACQPDREMPDCVEGLTDGYRGWDETALLLFASLLLPRVTKGLNRVVSSVTCWLSNRTLSIDEKSVFFSLYPGSGAAKWLVRGACSSLAGCSVSAVLKLQTRGPINANWGAFSEVDRCPLELSTVLVPADHMAPI